MFVTNSKYSDLQPLIDYFCMLRRYEQLGYLEVNTEKGEAYVTHPALHAMSDGDDPQAQLIKAIPDTVRHLRAYACWKGKNIKSFFNFAVHVVSDSHPHDMLFTLLLTRRRHWWCPWRMYDHIEVINYDNPKKP